MRQILMILFTLITCTASAQLYQRMPQYGYEMDRGRILLDLDIPTDTTTNKSGVVRIGTTLYAGNGSYWTAAATGTFDTAGIRIRPIPGTYMTITGTYPNLTFNVIYDSTVLQTKFRSDTNRTNVYTTLDTIIKYVSSPDGSVGITSSGRNIYFTVTGAPNSASPGNYIITYPTIERSNDTVDVIPNVVFQQGSLRDTITTGAQYVVPYASAGQKRIDPIIIDPSGLLDTLQGVEDSFFAVRPDLAAGSIVIADINVYGVDSIVVSNVGTFQRTAMGYFDANGKLTGDSTKYFVGSNTLNAPAFKSNVVGGVALSIDGGSAIRADRGSRVVYIDGDSSVTLRSGGYNHKAQLTAQGEFLIGTSGQVREPSARLAVIDSTKGFLPPVMRGVRMNAISSPATGLIVYNSDSLSLCLYNGSAWVKLGSGGSGSTNFWGKQGNAGTDPANDFAGTTDNVPFYLRVNNDTVAKFGNNTGNVSFGGGSATGIISFATGVSTASAEAASAFGQSTASGSSSTAMGSSTASGGNSTAMGASIANGNFSTAISSSTTEGDYSFAMGVNVAYSRYGTALGRNNHYSSHTINDTSTLLVVGNGYIDESSIAGTPSNILTVGYNGMIIGNHTSQLPDSTLTVVGGVAMPNLYESSDGTDSMVVKNADGGLGIRAIPGGGSTDTSGFAHKSYNLTETITGAKTFTGASTFSNTANGTANTTITGGVQGGSDNVGLLINGTFAGATNAHPFRVTPNFGFTSNGFAGAGIDVPFVTSGTANHDHVVGFQSVGTHGSSGTMTNAYGAYLGYVTNGGVTTNSYGVHIINPTGSGTITNNVGLYIANQTKGATNLGIQVAGSTAIEVGGISYLLGTAIVGHTTGVAPGAELEVRNNGANSFRMRNNGNWFQFVQPSGSADITFGSISGNNMKIYDGGNKTFFAPAQDSVSNSGLWVNHSFATAYLASSSSTINVSSNNFTVNADATSTNITANLPTAVGCKGRIYVVRKSDASVNTVTIDANSTETINGATTVTLTLQYSFRMMQSDGANWMVISQL